MTGLEPNWLDSSRRMIATRCSRVLSASPRACCINPIEPVELGLDLPRLLPLLGDYVVGTQRREQMHQRCPILVHKPANRFLAAAPRQMLSQIPRHRIFIEPL